MECYFLTYACFLSSPPVLVIIIIIIGYYCWRRSLVSFFSWLKLSKWNIIATEIIHSTLWLQFRVNMWNIKHTYPTPFCGNQIRNLIRVTFGCNKFQRVILISVYFNYSTATTLTRSITVFRGRTPPNHPLPPPLPRGYNCCPAISHDDCNLKGTPLGNRCKYCPALVAPSPVTTTTHAKWESDSRPGTSANCGCLSVCFPGNYVISYFQFRLPINCDILRATSPCSCRSVGRRSWSIVSPAVRGLGIG